MSDWVRVRRIGNSLTVTFAKCVSVMGIRAGDSLLVPKMSEDIDSAADDAEITEALEAGRDFMRRYPEAMKILAK